jgi:hypothetical protein
VPADVRAIAAAYGVQVELADLGDWGPVRLIAEYDPDGPTIRVDRRERAFGVERAIAHELYHHREAIGEVPRLRVRADRERAADAFAAELLGAT